MELAIKDKELFDKNPVYISSEGRNPEGFHVEGYTEELRQMSNPDLIDKYKSIRANNPYWKQTIQLIANEILKRMELKALSGNDIRKLSAKESADIYSMLFLTNLNSQPE